MPTSDPTPRTDREAELIAAAAAGELDVQESEEYAALVAADPTVAAEADGLRRVLDRLDDGPPSWSEPVPSPELAARVLAIPGEARAATTVTPSGRRRALRWLPLTAAAAVLLVVGGALGALLGDRFGGDDAASEGPPGTLGAIEPIEFEGEPQGVDIQASLVAHTWGTETVLDMDGWGVGESYQVVLVGTDGTVEDSGTFLGSEVPVVCRMNGAFLREDVDAIEIRDASGAVVARSDVPTVTDS